MKKKYMFFVLCSMIISLFGKSYVDNMYQKLADEFMQKAEVAIDDGEYDLSVEYAVEAEKNAELSQAYIASMLERSESEKKLAQARSEKARAERIKGQENFPMTFEAAVQALNDGEKSFEEENYKEVLTFLDAALELFASIKEITPLPEFYIVRPWLEVKDCYWNISGQQYIYSNPALWENLYQANKSSMKNPANPDLILPGMKMKIPSINGEYRDGTFDPKKQYEPFSNKR